MTTPNPSSLAGNFESAAQRMLETLQRASAELSESVNEAIEQLASYNLSLQKSLTDQLQQVGERFHAFAEQNDEELSKHKDVLLAKLDAFERAQIETMAAAAVSLRETLSSHAREAEAKLTSLVEDQLTEMEELVEGPQERMTAQSGDSVASLKETAATGSERIEKAAADGESALASRIEEFERELSELVEKWKQTVNEKIDQAHAGFREKSSALAEDLDKLLEKSLSELESQAARAGSSTMSAISQSRSSAQSVFDQWKSEVNQINKTFRDNQRTSRNTFETNHASDLDRRLTEAKVEIGGIAADAREKVQSAHKSFHGSLKRHEQDYKRRIESLLARFETTLSETARRSVSASSIKQRAARDLQEKLRTQLTLQGQELLKVVQKLAQQIESEYSRSGQGMDENIDNIAVATTEALEKQVQSMKNDLKKVSKAFQDDLEELESDLAAIEVAGKKAAEMVMTYRSAMLSLGGD